MTPGKSTKAERRDNHRFPSCYPSLCPQWTQPPPPLAALAIPLNNRGPPPRPHAAEKSETENPGRPGLRVQGSRASRARAADTKRERETRTQFTVAGRAGSRRDDCARIGHRRPCWIPISWTPPTRIPTAWTTLPSSMALRIPPSIPPSDGRLRGRTWPSDRRRHDGGPFPRLRIRNYMI